MLETVDRRVVPNSLPLGLLARIKSNRERKHRIEALKSDLITDLASLTRCEEEYKLYVSNWYRQNIILTIQELLKEGAIR